MSRNILFDGHRYSNQEDIPDLGSLQGYSQGNETLKRHYEGLYSDRDKLPKYNDLVTGSDALLIDPADGLHYLYYEATTKTWYEG